LLDSLLQENIFITLKYKTMASSSQGPPGGQTFDTFYKELKQT